ncbi:sulfotransferase domain-containing protein [Longibacter sp.]|uniref:sulfotransferase domain-containing protein n=1 Tax=Longibacter sp. TaxID=2045415 RepID=UPI003EBBB8CB
MHGPADFDDHDDLGHFVRERDVDVLAYTNANVDHVRDLPPMRAFHVVRDPRDVLVSAYFSHLHSHPTENWPKLVEHRYRLQSMSKEEGLMREMVFSEPTFDDMYTWDYDRRDVMEVHLEALSPSPESGFRDIFAFMNMLDRSQTYGMDRTTKSIAMAVNRWLYRGRHVLPSTQEAPRVDSWPTLPIETLQTILEEKSFERLSGGREKGEEDVTSHFRKGVPGDWKNHFTDEHVSAFKDRYNDLLLKLGYEEDATWTA